MAITTTTPPSSPIIGELLHIQSPMEEGRPSERVEVDTTRPFRSVKEAVAIFGERILVGTTKTMYSLPAPPKAVFSMPAPPKPVYSLPAPKTIHSAASSPLSHSSYSSHFNQDIEDQGMIMTSLRKLEAELEETKRELVLLKKRGSETEILVSSLNAELHKSMSRLAEMEAAGVVRSSSREIVELPDKIGSERWGEVGKGEMGTGLKYLPSLAQVMSLGEMDGKFGARKKTKVVKKKKPIMPLIGDVFSRRKGSGDLHDTFYTGPLYGVLS